MSLTLPPPDDKVVGQANLVTDLNTTYLLLSEIRSLLGGTADTQTSTEYPTIGDVLAAAVNFPVLSNGQLGSSFFADVSITTAKLANDAVTTSKVANLAVDTTKLADQSVGSSKIIDGSVVATKIALNSILGDKLVDGIVTNLKLADDSVSNTKIVSGAVDESKLATNAITTPKIADGSVNAAKVAVDIATQAGLNDHAASPHGSISSPSITTIDQVTQVAYDALTPPDPATLYVIVG